MQTYTKEGNVYHLAGQLNGFQLRMYKHLIDWKWKHITRKPGVFRNREYDALFPKEYNGKYPHIYDPILPIIQNLSFKFHKFFNHMASSQAACINLFLPLLQFPEIAAPVLRSIKPDIKRIATDQLDSGYRLEFWDYKNNCLNDHTKAAGTDADIAIAYYNDKDDLCLWLIEHKLTESEFTTCGGAKSKGRDISKHRCDSIQDILNERDLCYYHSACGYKYWEITLKYPDVFPVDNLMKFGECPFKGGLNQLWRNMLLALVIEDSKDWPYQNVYFSVVYHPKNHYLDWSMTEFKKLVGNTGRFFWFTSDKIIDAVNNVNNSFLEEWQQWYKELYLV